MKRFLFVCASLLILTACLSQQQREAVAAAGETINSVAPLLPPPLGLIAGGIATLLSGVASVGANKQSNKAFKAKEDPGILVKLLTEHSWAMPTLAALAASARAAGLIHFSDAELALFTSTLAVPVATKKYMRRKA